MGTSPENAIIEKFLDKIRMPATVKQVKRPIGFVKVFRSFIPKLGEKLLPFYKLFRKESVFKLTQDNLDASEFSTTDFINEKITLTPAKTAAPIGHIV